MSNHAFNILDPGPRYTRQDVPSATSNDWQSMVDTSTWNTLCSSVLSRKKLSRQVCRAAFGMRSSNWPADNGGMGSHIMRWCQDHTPATGDNPTYVIRQGIGCGVSVAIRFGVTSWAGCDGNEKTCRSCGCYATVGVPGNNAEWASYKDTLGCYHSKLAVLATCIMPYLLDTASLQATMMVKQTMGYQLLGVLLTTMDGLSVVGTPLSGPMATLMELQPQQVPALEPSTGAITRE